MPTIVKSPNYFQAICCHGVTYADAHSGANGTYPSMTGISVGQYYRSGDTYKYKIERTIAYFDLSDLVGKTITQAVFYVKFVRGTLAWWNEYWNWNLQFRFNPDLPPTNPNTVPNFLAALGESSSIFDIKYVADYPSYDWNEVFDVLAYVVPPAFAVSITSERDADLIPPSPSNTIEPAEFYTGYFSPGQTDKIKLVVTYTLPALPATGYIWVEGTNLAYSTEGGKALKEGVLTGLVGKLPGQITVNTKVDGTKLYYIDWAGAERAILGTLTGLTGKLPGQISVNTKAGIDAKPCYIDSNGAERYFEGTPG